jgi:Trk K+ transport system NAD-binding subunit
MPGLQDSVPIRHFVVCGDSPLAYRLITQLREQYDGHVTAIVPATSSVWADRIAAMPWVDVVASDRLDIAAFEAARLASADALALVSQDDGGNIDAALVAQELNPDLRIVVRMFNYSLGERISALLNNCAVLSAAAIAAPAFVAAALDETNSAPITIGDRTLVSTRRADAGGRDVICGLAVMGPRGTEPEVLPLDDGRADLVLIPGKPAAPPRPRRPASTLRMVAIVLGPRLRTVLAVFLVLFVVGTLILAAVDRQHGLGQAAYAAIITELSGSVNPVDNIVARIVQIVLTLVSIALIPALTATVVDSIVKARLRRDAGGLLGPIAKHMVVVGLGDVGTRVLRALHDQGIEIVAIERDATARGVQLARELDVPVIIGDASRPVTLNAASVATCRALIVASTDDVVNLETALLGRAAQPELRVVLRLFDGEFADRVRRAFNINISRSVSYLAAPAFAAAMLGRQVIATIPVRRRALLVAELPVGADSILEHQGAAAVNDEHATRLLAIRTGDGSQILWRPSDARPLRRTDKLLVVATRAGLATLLAKTAAPLEPDQSAPYRLLEPWQMPQSRTSSPEGPDEHPPFGPADAGSTRPA